MRIIVFLLFLANLLFFVWSQDFLGLSRSPNAFRLNQQLLPDQIRIVSNDVPPPEVAKPEEPKSAEGLSAERMPVDDICVQLSDLSTADAEQFETLFAEKLPAFKINRTTTLGTFSYWVHLPPAKSRRDAEDSVAELKRLGVREFFIMQENGPNDLAISLGLFSSRESATSTLEKLRAQGVRQARITERTSKPPISQLEIRGPSSQIEEVNQIIAQRGKDTRRGTCRQNSATPSR